MKKWLLLTTLFVLSTVAQSQITNKNSVKDILIRCDDIGMCHSVNMAAKKVLDSGFPVSMSVMVPCPWFSEAAEMLKQYKNVTVGIHLTLNSEWKQYRWVQMDSGLPLHPSLLIAILHEKPRDW